MLRRRWRASSTCPRSKRAVSGVDWVQENLPETARASSARSSRCSIGTRRPDAVLASSTSAIPASRFTEGLAGRARCLVAHPVNPPHLVPVVELCGAPWTAPATIERARAGATRKSDRCRSSCGASSTASSSTGCRARCSPKRCVSSAKATSRAEDLDKTVRDGLGLRWSFMGPLATIELNAPGGVADYCARYSGFYRRLAADPAGARRVGCGQRGPRRRRARRAAGRARPRRAHALARPPADGARRAQARATRIRIRRRRA